MFGWRMRLEQAALAQEPVDRVRVLRQLAAQDLHRDGRVVLAAPPGPDLARRAAADPAGPARTGCPAAAPPGRGGSAGSSGCATPPPAPRRGARAGGALPGSNASADRSTATTGSGTPARPNAGGSVAHQARQLPVLPGVRRTPGEQRPQHRGAGVRLGLRRPVRRRRGPPAARARCRRRAPTPAPRARAAAAWPARRPSPVRRTSGGGPVSPCVAQEPQPLGGGTRRGDHLAERRRPLGAEGLDQRRARAGRRAERAGRPRRARGRPAGAPPAGRRASRSSRSADSVWMRRRSAASSSAVTTTSSTGRPSAVRTAGITGDRAAGGTGAERTHARDGRHGLTGVATSSSRPRRPSAAVRARRPRYRRPCGQFERFMT